MSDNVSLTEKEKIEIASLKRGESLMFIGDNHVLAKVEVSDSEKKIMEETIDEENNNSNWQ